MLIKKWLEADYSDVLRQVNEQEARWKATGRSTRRNWWDVLAGLEDGTPYVIDDKPFPVLRAARRRKNWPDVDHAICRNENETAADFRFGRWGVKKRRARLPKKAMAPKKAKGVTDKVKKVRRIHAS